MIRFWCISQNDKKKKSCIFDAQVWDAWKRPENLSRNLQNDTPILIQLYHQFLQRTFMQYWKTAGLPLLMLRKYSTEFAKMLQLWAPGYYTHDSSCCIIPAPSSTSENLLYVYLYDTPTTDVLLLYRLNKKVSKLTFAQNTPIQVSSERLYMPTQRHVYDEFHNHSGAPLTWNCSPRTHSTWCLEGT